MTNTTTKQTSTKKDKYKIKFNPDLNSDITRLKKLHELKDKSAFNALKSEIILKYNVSKATVYREMRKATPGLYKILNYKPPRRDVTEKEIDMVKELLSRRIPVTDIAAIMESETGDNYDWDRIDKIRRIIDARPREASPRESGDLMGTNFGSSVKSLCEAVLKCNLMSTDSRVEFKCDDKTYSLCFNDVQDIAMVCANAVVRSKDEYFDYDNYAYQKIWWLFLQKISGINSGSEISTKELIDLKNALKEFEENHMSSFCKNFSVILGVAHDLAPDADYSKVFELTQKHSQRYPECKIDECLCWSELKRIKRNKERGINDVD
ncbi:MAG: hypothetical protein ACHQJ4_07185 [Ignavibacteria bacterium]